MTIVRAQSAGTVRFVSRKADELPAESAADQSVKSAVRQTL